MKNNKNRIKKLNKFKNFWQDTEAISPVVATILVLAVAVAAGLGLYLWFNPFQTSVQGQVGNSTTGQITSMTIDNAMVTLRMDNPSVDGINAANDTAGEKGYAAIWYADSNTGMFGPNGKSGLASKDERIIVEIPITIRSNTNLNDISLVTQQPVVNKGSLRSGMWLHLDKNNNYQLLNKNSTPFKGFIGESIDTIYVNNTNGYTYYFGGKGNIVLDLINGIRDNATGTLADNPATPTVDEDSISPARLATTTGGLMVIELFTGDGTHYWAFAKNNTGSSLGWITSEPTSKVDSYFKGSDKIEAMFHNGIYKVADKLNANEAVTVYTYFFVNILSLDGNRATNEDAAEFILPFKLTTKEGVTQTGSATLTIKD